MTTDKGFTLEQLQNAIDIAIGGREYSRVYRALKNALEEAHETLTLDDINEPIENADEEFAESHICTCQTCVPTAATSIVN